jgi:DNA-binding response OmpR family regulator
MICSNGSTKRSREDVVVSSGRIGRGADVSGDRFRVLVVEDFGHAAELLATLVRVMGHEAVATESARAAIDACASFDPHVVLLDLSLPDLCGYETARIMKACRPRMRIVAVTGWPDSRGAARAREVGIHEYVVKPFTRRHIERLFSSMRASAPTGA